MSELAPRPWAKDDESPVDNLTILDANGKVVTTWDYRGYSSGISRKHFQHIVACVNLVEELGGLGEVAESLPHIIEFLTDWVGDEDQPR